MKFDLEEGTKAKAERDRLLEELRTAVVEKECGKGRSGRSGNCQECHYNGSCRTQKLIVRADKILNEAGK